MINVPSVSDVVDFIFADVNCKLKLKPKTNRFFGFNSYVEFLNLVERLKEDSLDDEVPEMRKSDEKQGELFY